jgi:hypothetical protein
MNEVLKFFNLPEWTQEFVIHGRMDDCLEITVTYLPTEDDVGNG